MSVFSDIIVAMATAAGGGAAVFVAWTGHRALNTWRNQKRAERQAESAAVVLKLAMKVRDIFYDARSPITNTEELAEVKLPIGYPQNKAQSARNVRLPVHRLAQNIDALNQLQDHHIEFEALFGEEASEAIKSFYDMERKMKRARQILTWLIQGEVEEQREWTEKNLEQWEKWFPYLYRTGEFDPVVENLDKAIAIIRPICHKAILYDVNDL